MALGGSLAGVARVVLRVDDTQFNRDLGRDRDNFRRTTRDMTHDSESMARGVLAGTGAFHALGRSIAFASGSFLGAAGFTAVVRQSIGAASDLNEQMNKVRVVFKDGAQDVIEFSKSTTNSLGIAQGEALATAGTFGNMLVPMGFARKEAAGMSINLVKLAADMASFNNADPAQVLEALRSGLAGEVEPLRRFGVQLSDARERAILTEAGVKNLGGTLTAQQRTWAAYQLIIKDTADANGDFGRTSNGLANQQRILHAQLQQTEAQIGRQLLPTVLSVTKAVTGWLEKSENQETIQRDVNEGLRVAKAVVDDLHDAIEKADEVTGGFKQTLELLIGLRVGAKLLGWNGALQKLIGSETAAAGAAGEGLLGGAAAATFMRKALLRLNEIGVITIGIELIDHATGNRISNWLFRDERNPIVWLEHQIAKIGGFSDNGGGGGAGSGVTGPPTVAAKSLKAAVAPFMNVPYQWGGGHSATPGPSYASGHGRSGLGLDCSGYARAVLANLGITVNGTADQLLQSAKSHPPIFGLQPGDLIFYEGIHPQHVMVYIGNGQVIGETHTGASGPEIKPANYLKITGTGRYTTAGRNPNGPAPRDAPDDSGGAPPTGGGPKKKKATAKVDLTAMPGGISLAYENAVGAGDASAQIAALRRFITVLDQRKQLAKTAAAKADIQAEINQTRDKIRGIQKQGADAATAKAAAAAAKSDKATKNVISGIGSISDTLGSAIANLTAGGTGTQNVIDLTGKVIGQTFTGQSVVRFDPKSKQWIVTKVKPDLDALKNELTHIRTKVLPTLTKRINATQRAIQRLARHPKKNKAQLDHQRQILAALKGERSEVVGLASDLAQSIDEMADSLRLDPDPEAAEKAAAAAAEAQQQAERDAETAFNARADYLTGIPADIRLRQVEAQLTPDTADDAAVKNDLLSLTMSRIAEARNDPSQIESLITLEQRLVDLRGQEAQQIAATVDQMVSYLQARRDITRTYADTVFGRQFSGSQIVIQNTFANVPDDPHLYSQNLAFELKALT